MKINRKFISATTGFIMVCLLPIAPAKAGAIGFISQNGVIHFSPDIKAVIIKKKIPHKKKVATPPPKKKKESLETIIVKAQNKYGIETALIKAVIKAESGFDALAVSPRGAKGLMQIMPSNYTALGISNPFDPKENIMGGTKLLRSLILRYDNQLTLALAAYNAGTDAVDKYQAIPPYKETQNYVRKIIKLYQQYKRV